MTKTGYFLDKDGFRCLGCNVLVYPQEGNKLEFTEVLKIHTESHKKQEAK